MKNKQKIWITTGLIFIFLTIIPLVSLADGEPGEGPDAPIDGGISLLLAAGAAYGVKKYRDGKRKEVNKE